MVRAPCCEKMGLKRGPWTPEEDQILITHIQRYGHGNWRALPKQAGLLRCGKSCRLRWTNYLRPDIKRGNFSREEEDTIINLHELLGNRWSAMAAKLPGRTDNEIKNVWHTYLKKRVVVRQQNPAAATTAAQEPKRKPKKHHHDNNNSSSASSEFTEPTTPQIKSPAVTTYPMFHDQTQLFPASPLQSCSDFSSCATEWSTESRENLDASIKREEEYTDSYEQFAEINIDDNFWSEALSLDQHSTAAAMDFTTGGESAGCIMPPGAAEPPFSASMMNNSCKDEDDMDFWLRVLMGAEELPSF